MVHERLRDWFSREELTAAQRKEVAVMLSERDRSIRASEHREAESCASPDRSRWYARSLAALGAHDMDAFWNAAEWLLIRVDCAQASQLLLLLNDDQAQPMIAKWPVLAALRDKINSSVNLELRVQTLIDAYDDQET